MKVYDFDKTIFSKDSTVSFYLFCLKKNPLLLRYLVLQIWYYLQYVFNFIDKTKFKQKFFCFLRGIKNIEDTVNRFWQKNFCRMREWYLRQKTTDDVIVSASPEFLLRPACERLGVRLIASRVDAKTGEFLSPNCRGEEKVRRFLAEYPTAPVEEFYSDSTSDYPLALLADAAYLVKSDQRILWKEYKPSLFSKIKETFFAKEFIGFLIVGLINAANGVLFASLFTLCLKPNPAFAAGYAVSLTISYVLNTLLVFKSKFGVWRYIKFCISYIPNFLIQNGLVYLLYNWAGLNKYLVYVLAVLLAIPITFLMLRFFTFGKNKKK